MVAAGAGPAIGEEDGVAEFAGVAVLAGVEFAVNEDSHADAFVDVQEDHIFKVLCAGGFADDGEVGFIFYDDRNLKVFFEVVFQVGVFQIVVGCELNEVVADDAVDSDGDSDEAARGLGEVGFGFVEEGNQVFLQGEGWINRVFFYST